MDEGDQKVLDREDHLSGWRLASLLAFNGFIYSGYVALLDKDQPYLISATPIMALLVSVSILIVAIKSSIVKYPIHCRLTGAGYSSSLGASTSPFLYAIFQALGPNILSSAILTLFWVGVIYAKV